jgi:hypothetical protein
MSDDLRDRVRRTFDDELGRFPPPSGLRARMVTHALAGGQERNRADWALAAAAAAIAVAVVASLLLGLRSLRPPPQPASTPPPVATASPSPAPGAAPTPDLSPAATPSPATPGQALPRCRTWDLAAQVRALDAAAGQRAGLLVLTNRSGHACQTYGFIGMQLIDSAGRPVPTSVVRVRQPPPAVLTLAPDASVHSVLTWGAVPGPGEPATGECEPAPAAAEVTPPDETTQIVIRWDLGPVCQRGGVTATGLADGAGPPA